jgi:hypothetical protein
MKSGAPGLVSESSELASVLRGAIGFGCRHSGALHAFLGARIAGIAGQHGNELPLGVVILAAPQVLPGLIDQAAVLAWVQIAAGVAARS